MSDRIYSIDEVKSIVAPIAMKYDVDRVFLFGSYARGEANNRGAKPLLNTSTVGGHHNQRGSLWK